MNQPNNFIQSHARNRRYVSKTVAQMQAVDSIDSAVVPPRTNDTATQESLTGLERSERVTRRLDEAVLRLDRAASMRRQRETVDETTAVETAVVEEPVIPAPKTHLLKDSPSAIKRPSDRLKPMRGDRRDDATGMQLDASVTESTSIWMETADQSTRLRIDRPVDVDDTARRIGEPLIVSGVAKIPASPAVETNTIEMDASPAPAFDSAPPRAPVRDWESHSVPDVAARVTLQVSEAERYLAESMQQQTADIAEPTPVAEPAPVAEAQPVVVPTEEPKEVAKRAFVAAWQVTELEIPDTVSELFLCGSLADQLGQHIVDAQVDGLGSIAVTSVLPGEGRSTVAMGIALSVAYTGMKVALVDADIDGPTLSDDFALELDLDWIDAIRDGIPVEEVAVASESDALTLIPLLPGADELSPASSELEQVVERLKQSFDLVIIDCGTAALSTASLCDSALIVRDMSRTNESDVEALVSELRRNGLTGVGIVENFCQDTE
ncbi:Tyrosine-protein kinase Wzc [Rhodopirellula islandica]|uniref:Tyrosine-protein kinase Wzc n=1 Tax=Rhodopirellula islandica TaxID=595434 RepID=A0A0J1B5W1_RHOIS|nr:CpsD/CapB family tyrosine-protein kinase [Rhodopirellula islandica]KLU02122.1 Tyrosine-protein kinase Wzc [Rhodopirellula islandica]